MQAHLTENNGVVEVSGNLDFETVPKLWQMSLPILANNTKFEFDFSNVKNSNSAGVALMLAWLKYAKEHRKEINFSAIPSKVISILSVAGISELVPAAK